MSIAAFIPYLTLQITGAGYLFEAATGGNVPFWLGALAAFAIVALYVYSSGLRGIGWTNVGPELVVNVANFSPWLIGIMLSGALAAAMSTGSNLAHTASTVLVRDLFVAVFKQDSRSGRW